MLSDPQDRAWLESLQENQCGSFAQRVKGGAQDTKNRISKGSRSFFTFAHDRGHTSDNLGTVIEQFRPGGPRVDWLEWPDVHKLTAAIPDFRYRFAATWLFWTGCRVSEACAAQQQDVQFRRDADLYQWTIPDSKTHVPRSVWLPDALAGYIDQSREMNKPNPSWPLLWDCSGRGFGRYQDPASAITPRVINSALERAREAANLPVRITAHIAKHSYCTNWVQEHGSGELAMEKLSRQVGTSVTVLRRTYVHFNLDTADWAHIKTLGASGGTTVAA